MSVELNSYMPHIDRLRGFAIIFVLFYHFFPNFFKGGFIGVDIFFVISGYLITKGILQDLHADKFSLLNFYKKRVIRIFPALILVLFFSLILGYYTLLPNDFNLLRNHVAGGAFFVSNFIYFQESGYFDNSIEFKYLANLWSLSVEEQFYLIWPLIILFLFYLKINIFITILIITILSFLLNLLLIDSYPFSTFYLLHTRFFELSLGGIIAQLKFNDYLIVKIQNRKYLSKAIYIFPFFILFQLSFFLDSTSTYPGYWVLLPITCSALIIYLHPLKIESNYSLSSSLIYIGLISYPLYLWHWPILSFSKTFLGGELSMPIKLSLLALTFLIAALTFHFVEQPIRRRRTSNSIFIFLVACSFFIGSCSILTPPIFNPAPNPSEPFTGGASEISKFSQTITSIESTHNQSYGGFHTQIGWNKEQKDLNCESLLGSLASQIEFCRLSNFRDPTILLIGDSQAWQLFFGLQQFYKSGNETILSINQGACPGFLGFSYRSDFLSCQSVISKSIDLAMNHKSIHTIIISGSLYNYASNTKFYPIEIGLNFNHNFSSKSDFMISSATNFNKFLQKIPANINIILVSHAPPLSFDPRECIPKQHGISTKISCNQSTKTNDANIETFNMLKSSIAERRNAKILDISKLTCDENYCWALKNNKLLYRDKSHLSRDGSFFIAPYLAAHIQ
jgi:peptidoglycan/LPS O-acetylase OafA/YrhL